MVRVSKGREVAAAAAVVAPAEPEQLAIEDILGSAEGAPVRRGRGRPAGARNRKTTEMIEYLEALGYEPPMLQLAKVARADTRALAAALRCSRLEAFDRQQTARVALMPYWHSRMPIEAVVQTRASIGIVLGALPGEPMTGAVAGDEEGAASLLALAMDDEENQQVSGVMETDV